MNLNKIVVRHSRALVLLAGMAIAFPMWAQGPRVKKQDPAIYFWYHFRTAVKSNQFQKFEPITLFPFEQTSLDGTSVRLSKKAFREKISGYLDQSFGAGLTMRRLIEEKEDLSDDERAALLIGDLTIGVFRFKTIKDKCYWVGSTAESPRETAVATPVHTHFSRPEASLDKPAPPTPEKNDDVKTERAVLPTANHDAPRPEIADPRTESVFRFFWVDFRRAALSNDFETLRRLTRFPFELKGPLEDDKIKKYPAREFDLVWPRLMEADPRSWGPIRDSMRELMERREEPSVEEIATEPSGEIQVGIFVFRKSKNRWRFTRAILAE